MTDVRATIWATPAAGCPACERGRRHEASEIKEHHPYAGHGFTGVLWSHPALDPAYLKKWAAAKAAGTIGEVGLAGTTAKLQAQAAGVEP